jgi:hypothetical protein
MIEDPSNPVPPAVAEAAGLYQAFMEEIKTRLGVIAEVVTVVKGDPQAPRAFLHAEFGFLQMRMICDLVALAVLAAHRPYGLTDELLASWHARRALHDLSAINPLSFPRPAKVSRDETSVTVNIDDTDALKRKDLQDIYNKCGRMLHRGALKHILGQGKEYDIGKLDGWARKIGALLGHHALLIPDEGLFFVVNLTSGPDGSAEVAISMAPGPVAYAPLPDGNPPPEPKAEPDRPAEG